MTKKRQFRPLVAAAWILALCLQLWLLFNDVNLVGTRQSKAPDGVPSAPAVAALSERINQVRVQEENDILWQDTSDGQNLLEGQSVMTLEASGAEVLFPDGTGLVLGENSLVQIRSKASDTLDGSVPLMVSLVRGSVRKVARKKSGSARPLTLQVGNSEVRTSAGSEVLIEALPDGLGAHRVQVGDGEVEIASPSGQVKAHAGEQVRVPAPTETASLKVAPAPALPPEPSLEALRKAAPPEQAPAMIVPLPEEPLLAPAPAPAPKVAAPRPEPKARPLSAPKSLGAPKFVPRFKSRKKDGQSRFVPLPAPFVALLWGAEAARAEAEAESEEPVWDVELEWSPVKGAARYKVQVAQTRDFEKTLLNEAEVERAKWAWGYRRGLENSKGRVFYRVAAVDKKGVQGPFSKPEPIVIPAQILAAAREAAKPKPAPPQKPEEPSRWEFGGVALYTGLSTFAQTTSTEGLTGVSSDSLYLDQSLDAELAWIKGSRAWTGRLSLGLSGFEGSETQGLEQAGVTAFWADLRVFRGTGLTQYAWRGEWGLAFDYGYRWKLATVESVSAAGAFSAGPAYRARVRWADQSSGLRPRSLLIEAALPATGLLTGGQGALQAEGVAEWGTWRVLGVNAALRLRAAAQAALWDTPTRTFLRSFNLGIGIVAFTGR